MPKLTRKTGAVEVRKPFGVYDGALPPRGVYPVVIRSASIRKYDSGTLALNFFVVIEAPDDSPKAEFNGYGFFTQLFLGEHEAQLAREAAAYLAISGKRDADVVYEKEPTPGNDSQITKIGGVTPIGVKVRADLRLEEYPKGSGQYDRRGDSIYAYDENGVSNAQPKGDPDADPDATPAPAAKAAPAKRAARKAPAKAEPEVTVDSEPADEAPEDDVDYGSMTLPALKAAARAKGIDPAGKKKSDLIDELADLRGVTPGSEEADDSNPAAEWGEDDVPPANEVEALTDDQFWAWADTKFEDDLATLQESSRQEIFDMMVEDGVVAPF